MLPATAAFALTAVLEWVLAMAGAQGGFGTHGAFGALATMVGLWGLLAFVASGLLVIASRAALGRAASPPLLGRVAALLSRLHGERGEPADRWRVATLLGALAGAAFFFAASFVFVAYLIEHRHGAMLIAFTALVGQVALLVVALVGGAVLRRAIAWLLFRVPLLRRRPCFTTLLAALALLGAAGLAAAAYVFRRTIVAADGIALGLPILALALYAVLTWRFSRRWPAGRWVWAQPLVCLLLVLLAAQPGSVRRAVQQEGHSSRYLLHTLASLSDFDGDGAPVFPVMLDCAPFDASRHPYALEIPGNGIDENCDGSDTLEKLWDPERNAYEKRPGPRPNLILVTFDALRADHLGFMGYDRPTSPNLDRVAAQAVVFDNTFSQDGGTGPSLWSLAAGKTPFQVRLENEDKFPPALGPDEKLLAEQLKAGGYATEAVLCGYVFGSPRWNLKRGYDKYANVCGRGRKNLAKGLTDKAIAALKRLDGHQPFFLWVHYYDPHDPYNDHEKPEFGDRPMDNYDEEIAYADREFGRFWRAVQKLGPSERPTYLAVGADHGENFGEHGRAPHARNLYRVVTHIPHFVVGDGIEPRRVEAPVALNDLYVTFQQLAGLPIPEETTMTGHVGVLFGAPADPTRMIFQENSYSRPKRHVKAVIRGRFHFISDLTTGVDELYDMEADPKETENLVGKGLPEEAALRHALQRFVQTTNFYPNLSD